MKNLIKKFVFTAGCILALSALAKIISAGGHARVLVVHDPFWGLRYRELFLLTAALELLVAGGCFFLKRTKASVIAICWLATIFLAYRVGLHLMGDIQPCKCLGNLTEKLNISPESADLAMQCVLAYLLSGGYCSLLWLWRSGKTMPAPGKLAPAQK